MEKKQFIPEPILNPPHHKYLKEYCFDQEISLQDAMTMIESGKIVGRVIDGEIVILDSPQLEFPALEPRRSHQLERLEQLIHHAAQKLDEWDKKLTFATSTIPPKDAEIAEKDRLIQKLRHDLEDLTTLNNTLSHHISNG